MDLFVRVKMPLSSENLAQLQAFACDGPYDADEQDAYFFASSRYEDALKALSYVLEVKPVPQPIKHTITRTIHVRAMLE